MKWLKSRFQVSCPSDIFFRVESLKCLVLCRYSEYLACRTGGHREGQLGERGGQLGARALAREAGRRGYGGAAARRRAGAAAALPGGRRRRAGAAPRLRQGKL